MMFSTVRKNVNTGVTHQMEHANLKTHANRSSQAAPHSEVSAQSPYLNPNCYQLFWNQHTAAIVHSLPDTKKHTFLLHHGEVGKTYNELQAEQRLTGVSSSDGGGGGGGVDVTGNRHTPAADTKLVKTPMTSTFPLELNLTLTISF